jgi:hypothetical protein
MRRTLAVLAAAVLLAACQHLTPAQTLEQGDTAASLAYAATATICNDVAAAFPAKATAAHALELQAWKLLVQERALYAQGASITDLVSQLQALEAQAKGL